MAVMEKAKKTHRFNDDAFFKKLEQEMQQVVGVSKRRITTQGKDVETDPVQVFVRTLKKNWAKS